MRRRLRLMVRRVHQPTRPITTATTTSQKISKPFMAPLLRAILSMSCRTGLADVGTMPAWTAGERLARMAGARS
jgi:hypothetical protein